MAFQHKIFVRGKLGPVIFYERYGIGYAKQAERQVRQTPATKASAQLFGKAAQIAKILRRNTGDIRAGGNGRNSMIRLNQAVQGWLRGGNTTEQDSIHLVTGFEFNPDKELQHTLRFHITADFTDSGDVHVTIPAFELPNDVKAPAHTVALHWDIFVNSCRVTNSTCTGEANCRVKTQFNHGPIPEQKVSLRFDPGKECITVVVVGLRFTTGENFSSMPILKPEAMPMQIVAARYR